MSQQFERATGRSKTQRRLYLINVEAMRRSREEEKKSFLLSLQLTNLSLNCRQQLQEEATLCVALFQDRPLETL